MLFEGVSRPPVDKEIYKTRELLSPVGFDTGFALLNQRIISTQEQNVSKTLQYIQRTSLQDRHLCIDGIRLGNLYISRGGSHRRQ
jgi:hypothetical protein